MSPPPVSPPRWYASRRRSGQPRYCLIKTAGWKGPRTVAKAFASEHVPLVEAAPELLERLEISTNELILARASRYKAVTTAEGAFLDADGERWIRAMDAPLDANLKVIVRANGEGRT